MAGSQINMARIFLTAIAASLFFISLFSTNVLHAAANPDTSVIRVGILHSQTGTMAVSEKPVINATLLAIEQINAAGGLLGKQLQPIIADGKSDEKVFAAEAERLISVEHVDVIFGCWTSASRKAVKPVVEKYEHLLFYPVQYEGLEESDHIIYTGATPNQQIIPAVSWSVKKFGSRVYLVGSDYIFPRVANWLIKKQLPLIHATLVGEKYLHLGSRDVTGIVADIVADIRKQQPDVIFNTINGKANSIFFHALKLAGIHADKMPVMSFSLAEPGIQQMPVDEIAGHYAAWNYFQSLPGEANKAFVAAFQKRFGDAAFGKKTVVSDPMEAAWVGVQMWASAVRREHTSDPKVIHQSILHESMHAPEGIVSVDQANRHVWKTPYIGRVNRQHQFDIVWSGEHAIRPFPYPLFVSRDASKALLKRLYAGWGERWSAPQKADDKAP